MRIGLLGQRLAVLACGLLLWQLVAGELIPGVRLVDPYFISSPGRIFRDLVDGFSRGTLLRDVGITLLEATYGLVLGMGSGIVVGLAFAFWQRLDDLFGPYMGVLNSLPRPALAPLAILWFGLGMSSKVFVAWTLVFFVAFYNTFQGVKSIEPEMVNAIRIMRPTRWQLMRIVILPAVFSWVFAAFKLSVSLSLIGAIVGEFVGSTAGLGYQLITAQGLLQTDRVFSVFVLTGVVAAIVLSVAQRVENALLKWRPTVQLTV